MRDLKGISNIAPMQLWNYLVHPWKIEVFLGAPRSVSSVEAISRLFPQITKEEIEACKAKFLNNEKFFNELNRVMVKERGRHIVLEDWNDFLYMLVRFAKPSIVVETGVFDGQSSAIILQALFDNGHGRLISIDLPANVTIQGATHAMRETTLPAGRLPGWAIPEYLRLNHTLIFGDSRIELPSVMREHGIVDIFFHDSLHTLEHQDFEYTLAWKHIPNDGFLISDDIFWTPAFHRFCRRVGKPYLSLGRFGAVKK